MRIRECALVLLAALGLGAQAQAIPTTTSSVAAEAASQPVDTLIDRLQRAGELLDSGQYQAADTILRGLLDEPDFEGYSEAFKFATYSLAAGAALSLEDPARAADLLDRALASPAANAQIAYAALELYLQQGQPRRAIPAVRILAAQAPGMLLEFDSRTLFRMNAEFSRLDIPRAERLGFLRALFDANLLLPDGRQPSPLWRQLAELYLEDGDADAAGLVAQRIAAPNDLLGLQVDRRFDDIVARMSPDRRDIGAALARESTIIRTAIASDPRSLQNVVELTYVLLDAGSYQELLDTCDAALSKVTAAAKDAPAFDDQDEALPWIHDNRARALLGLGRVDEAVAVFDAARRMDEDGGANTSQAINISALYAALDRPQDALDALAAVEDASPFGWMQFHLARVQALRAAPDDPRLRESLDFLRGNRAEAPGALIEALIRVGELEEASAAFRDRLEDPEERNAALVSAQRLVNDPVSPTSASWIAQDAAFFSRPEIVGAIEAVGRFVAAPLHEQAW